MRLFPVFLVLIHSTSPSVATEWPQPQSNDDERLRHHPGLNNLDLSINSLAKGEDDDSWTAQQIVQSDAQQTTASEQKHHTLKELHNTLEVLQNLWFDLSSGTWPTSIDWTGAVLNTHLVATLNTISVASARSKDHDQELDDFVSFYFAQTSAYYFGEDAVGLKKQAYDDMLWVVLSWLESVKLIKAYSTRRYGNATTWYGHQYAHVFANRAKDFYNITTHGWSDELCQGGMNWNPSLEPYKNAITNELFISASVGMYLHFLEDHSTSYFTRHNHTHRRFLTAAVDGYEWLKHSNMTNSQGLLVDGYHIPGWNKNGTGGTVCSARNEMVYTYNQGVLLSGLHGLWEATNNETYLRDGHRLVRTVLAASGWDLKHQQAKNHTTWHGLGRGGIMEEVCDSAGECDQNGQAFKSIYFHHLALFCKPLPLFAAVPGITYAANSTVAGYHKRQCKRYRIWVARNAHAAMATRDNKGRVGSWWGARNGSIPEPASLPVAAVDYRNHGGKLKDTMWTTRVDGKTTTQTKKAKRKKKTADSRGSSDTVKTTTQHDWNDRGRGRTVESHSSGVAVLRCLWELLDID